MSGALTRQYEEMTALCGPSGGDAPTRDYSSVRPQYLVGEPVEAATSQLYILPTEIRADHPAATSCRSELRKQASRSLQSLRCARLRDASTTAGEASIVARFGLLECLVSIPRRSSAGLRVEAGACRCCRRRRQRGARKCCCRRSNCRGRSRPTRRCGLTSRSASRSPRLVSRSIGRSASGQRARRRCRSTRSTRRWTRRLASDAGRRDGAARARRRFSWRRRAWSSGRRSGWRSRGSWLAAGGHGRRGWPWCSIPLATALIR